MLGTAPVNLTGDARVIARAEAVQPMVAAAANDIERDRRLPAALLDSLHEAALFRLLLPRSANGIETDPVTFFHVIETIAKADASTAWCLSQAGGCAMSAAYLDLPVAHAIFGNDPRAVLAWGPGPKVKAVECEGGYKVTGVWAFASGGRHATWLGAHCPIFKADGSLKLDDNGVPQERTMLVRSEDVAWTDIWNTVGLRGTASDQFALNDFFVRADHSITREFDRECRENGPLYRMGSGTLLSGRLCRRRLRHRARGAGLFCRYRAQQGGAGHQRPAARQRRGAIQPGPGRGEPARSARLRAAIDRRRLDAIFARDR